MTLQTIDYSDRGVAMRGYLADGSRGAPAPGVLIAHEASGLDDHVKQCAAQLAELGFVAFAMDLYGEPPSVALTAERHAHVMGTPGLIRDRASAALDVLARHPCVDPSRLAAIGFCQGGVVATELARAGAPIRAAIGFHPGLKPPAGSLSGPIDAKILMMIGDRDPVVPIEDQRAFAADMDASGADWQLHVFGGVGHAFTNRAADAQGIEGFAYHEPAARRSWRLMRCLLDEVFADAAPLPAEWP